MKMQTRPKPQKLDIVMLEVTAWPVRIRVKRRSPGTRKRKAALSAKSLLLNPRLEEPERAIGWRNPDSSCRVRFIRLSPYSKQAPRKGDRG
jgi:hypothetical protein